MQYWPQINLPATGPNEIIVILQCTLRKKMATGTFIYNALRTKTIKERIKPQRKIVIHSNSTRAMLSVRERLPLNHIFPNA